MKLFKTSAEIDKAVKSIANRGAKLDGDIHVAGVSILAHASEHGDTTIADRLIAAMPKGARKLALVEWMLAYGQLAKLDPKVDKDAIAAGRVFKLDRTRTLDIESAISTPWTEFKPEAAVSEAFDAQAAMKSLVTRLVKAAENGKVVKGRAEALAQLDALRAALAAQPKVEKVAAIVGEAAL